MDTYKKYSDRDIADWNSYERIRLTGSFNMYDPRAMELTKLTKERYIFIMEHYDKLRIQAHIERMKNIKSLSRHNE